MLRSLFFYWRINLAVLLGAAVATAVLTGALLVGDSVRASLRNLTLERLGAIDHALIADRFFREALANELKQEPGFDRNFEDAAPALLMSGSATHGRSRALATNVTIAGFDARTANFFPGDRSLPPPDDWLPKLQRQPGQSFAPVVINAALQRELGAEIGDQVLLAFEQESEIHRESLFGSNEASDLIRTLRLQVAGVLPDRGIGRFGLRPHQAQPLNAFVALEVLQRALGETGRVNAVLVSARDGAAESAADSLAELLAITATSSDLGLKILTRANHLTVESREFVLKSETAEHILTAARRSGATPQPVLTYLANAMIAGDRLLPYSTITAIDPVPDLPWLQLAGGQPAPPLAEDEIYLNTWAANDLGAAAGDTILVTYYVVGLRGDLRTDTTAFRLRAVLPITALAADASLAPDFPGISGAENMADWEPTFPVDLRLIRDKDEAYWDVYRATPKAFVAAATGQRLWRSRFGDYTAIRLAPPPGLELATTSEQFTTILHQLYTPARAGLVFQPVKAQGLASSQGATDFGGLFIGMSFFLLASAALLAGLLFRLGVEQRAGEIGVLLSTGYNIRQVRWRFFKDALVIAGIGCAVGLAGAIAYSGFIMYGLRTWWRAAVGTSFLYLHVTPASLVTGYLLALAVVLFATWRTVRRLGRLPTLQLLGGATTFETPKSGRIARFLAPGTAVAALALVAGSFAFGLESSAELFGASGALLLVSGLAFLSLWLRRARSARRAAGQAFTARQMSARNTALFPGRSMLCVALVACACFLIVAVGANHQDFGRDVVRKDSGAGGYTLMAEADIPLHADLSTTAGRFDLGFSDQESELLAQTGVTAFRLLPGDDASCLNLYRPQKPRVLGVPAGQIERGGFSFRSTGSSAGHNPWQLLQQEMEPGVVPAFADYNSAAWILQLGFNPLGKEVVLQNEFGEEIRLRLVGLLQKSLFQSELLIAEEAFIHHFPSRSGYGYFLIDAPLAAADTLATLLERNLGDYGFDAQLTAQKLASFQAVENTYLAVFQTLGGLGLLLGTIGLAIVLFRNAIERKKELATLRAFGYRRRRLSRLLLGENALLIATGLLIGALSALIAVFPHLLSSGADVPWLSLLLTLLLIFIIGLVASAIAASLVLRLPLLLTLKSE